MIFLTLLSYFSAVLNRTSGLPFHIDHKKIGEVFINKTKFNMLKPVYHITEEELKNGINLSNVATRKVFVDIKGGRHFWMDIEEYKLSRKFHKKQKHKIIEENALVKADENEETTDVVELVETVTEQTDANENNEENGLAEANENEETTDAVELAETAIEQTEANADELGATVADENEQTDANPDEAETADVNADDDEGLRQGNPTTKKPAVPVTTKATTKAVPATTKAAPPTTKAAPTKPKPTPPTKKVPATQPLPKLTYLKTTFFCPFLGVFTTNHYNYEINEEETTQSA